MSLLPPIPWLEFIGEECNKAYYQKLEKRIKDAYLNHPPVFPPQHLIFNALEQCTPEQTRVVIIGQDPYPTAGYAHGLAFSVRNHITPLPKSLQNIFRELTNDVRIPYPNHGDLSDWAKQGVLLLNTILTVSEGSPGSHAGFGWEQFTDHIIHRLNQEKQHVVVMLWGTHAQRKIPHINTSKHLILTAPHPSPLSAYRGFLGCGHFSKANAFLESKGLPPIAW